jgi:hypothetical protein
MSYVHFLDVFDPAGQPDGLTDHDAAEAARSRRLTSASPRLLALLTRIRQQPLDITVNVVGGKDQQPVHWVAGPPPGVTGDGASCALWTLILPVEDDFDALQDAVPRFVVWAKGLGLGVYDPQQEAFDRQQAQVQAATQAIVARRAEKPPADPSTLAHNDIILIESHGFSMNGVMSTFASFREARPQLSLREVCDARLTGRQLDHSYSFGMQWVIQRLLQQFPFEGDTAGLWCGRHPVNEPVSRSDGAWVVRVATTRLDEVLRELLPLARSWFLTVVVPEQDFYVNRTWDPAKFSAHPMERLQVLDPGWKNHRLTDKQGLKVLTKALGKLLEPRGFQLVPEYEFGAGLFLFERSLMNGQVRHVVFFANGDGLVAQVRSQRYLEACVAPIRKRSYQSLAEVAEMSLRTNRYREDSESRWGSPGEIWSELQCSLAVEDLERLILPLLEGLRTAADLWNWHRHQPVAAPKSDSEVQRQDLAPSVGDWAAARDWLFKGTDKPWHYRDPFRMDRTMYAARCLPDEQLFPMLEDWLKAFHPEGPIYTPRAKQLIEILRAMPQTPLDAPL